MSVQEDLYGQSKCTDLSSLGKPTLIIVIDTEEEFPWHLPHDRDNVAISAIKELGEVQGIFDSRGVVPCYVIDYPVASDISGHEELKAISAAGRCEIGMHLHPWVSPPFTEKVNNRNSFPGNLTRELELAKLSQLKKVIEENFGGAVKIYKAGRYGVGKNTVECLAELGINIDLSPTPGFNYLQIEGPDYSNYTNRPFWFGGEKQQLCVPCTGGFTGWGGRRKPGIYELLNRKPLLILRAPGIAAKFGLVERIRLSPEGYTLEEMKKVTESLLKLGEMVFTLSFHSPSLKPGCTPYVKTKYELDAFLSRIQSYLDYFVEDIGGSFSHPGKLYKLFRDNV